MFVVYMWVLGKLFKVGLSPFKKVVFIYFNERESYG